MSAYGIALRFTGRTGSSDSPASGLGNFVALAREIEDAGFGGIYIPEAVNDALLCSLAVANATRRITVGTWIVNIYLREPALCAIARVAHFDTASFQRRPMTYAEPEDKAAVGGLLNHLRGDRT